MARSISIVPSVSLILVLQLASLAQPSAPSGTQSRGELVSYNEKTKTFSPYLSGISAAQVEVSPNGEWVAYVSYPDAVLWRSKIDGTQRQALTKKPMNPALPRWSPDSQHIAFMATAAPDQ